MTPEVSSCSVCHQPFTRTNPRQVYCSDRHKWKGQNIRRAAKVKAYGDLYSKMAQMVPEPHRGHYFPVPVKRPAEKKQAVVE